ncbi:metal-dependent hydrolase [Marinomonas agarivorans]|nr:metal-dependent hydrolase [Marinomonas agarivorans]
MPNLSYRYEKKQVDKIPIRKFDFIFSSNLDPIWIPENPARSHLFNGLSVTMPYLEPYLIKSTKASMGYISEPRLLEDIRGFCGQEAQHYRCHRKFNDLLKKKGHPKLAKVEEKLEKTYKKLLEKSLRTQLAYNAGFECMTNGLTHWLISKRVGLFRHASPTMVSFWLMHAIEEVEHKTVAYDAYMAYSGAYLPRCFGVFHGSFHVMGYAIWAMLVLLKEDKRLFSFKDALSAGKEISLAAYHMAPYLFRALLPNHNPRCEDDPKWMTDWVAGYEAMLGGKVMSGGEAMPLIDTADPQMPVPFASPSNGICHVNEIAA